SASPPEPPTKAAAYQAEEPGRRGGTVMGTPNNETSASAGLGGEYKETSASAET
ncbi:hypothetical protein THAOC_31750, partial [Thalassiosira oceanica]